MNKIEFNIVGETLDTIFSFSSKYARWLNVRHNRLCFIIWTICCLYWMGRDLYLGLYSQGIFCAWSVGLNIYGYVRWKRLEG